MVFEFCEISIVVSIREFFKFVFDIFTVEKAICSILFHLIFGLNTNAVKLILFLTIDDLKGEYSVVGYAHFIYIRKKLIHFFVWFIWSEFFCVIKNKL